MLRSSLPLGGSPKRVSMRVCAVQEIHCVGRHCPAGVVHASMGSARHPLCRSSLAVASWVEQEPLEKVRMRVCAVQEIHCVGRHCPRGCACEYGQCKASTVQVVPGRCELGRARAARKSVHASMCSARNPLCSVGDSACEYGQCKASTVKVVTGRCELGRARAAGRQPRPTPTPADASSARRTRGASEGPPSKEGAKG